MIRVMSILKSPAFLLLLAIFTIYLASSAHASPKVGDYIQFLMTNRESSGRETKMRIESEIVAFDRVSQMFRVKETQTPILPAGPAEIDVEDVEAAELITLAQIEEQLRNCTASGGRTESLRVPAGQFSACRILSEDEESSESIWHGRVPQGVIKSQLRDRASGFSTQIELQQFRFGTGPGL